MQIKACLTLKLWNHCSVISQANVESICSLSFKVMIFLIKPCNNNDLNWVTDKVTNINFFPICLCFRCLDRHSLLIWPSMTTSFPNIQTSPVLSSLVFTGYNKPILGHVTHSIQPILDEKELPPKKAGTSKAHPTSPLKHSSTGPFSPTGHHHHHHHHKHHKHHRHHHHHKSQAVVSPNDESKSSVYVYPEV